MNRETTYGVKTPVNCMDSPAVDQAEYIPYLADLVSCAKAEIPFYSRLYRQCTGSVITMDHFRELPFISEGMLIRERLEDMVGNLNGICEVCYPAGRLTNDCCMPRVQSQEDQEDQYLILEWILKECLGLDIENNRSSIAMVTDEDNSYWAGTFSKMMILLCNRPFFGLVARGHTPSELSEELSRCDPELLIISGTPGNVAVPDSVGMIVEIGEHPRLCFPNTNVRHFHVLTHPLLGFIGCSVNRSGVYAYNPDHYYIETSPDRMIVYTSFMQKLMPMIRLRTRHWGKVLKPGLVEVTYRGTH